MKPKILFFDIETSPNIGYFWRPGNKISIPYNNIIQERAVICICYKYAGKKRVHTLTWDMGEQCDYDLLEEFVEIINGCDVAIGHNGDNFDIKWVKGRLLYHGLPPATNITSLDTLKMSRANFNLNSHRLDYIGQYLGVGQKVETGGFGLWTAIMDGDERALNKMVKYCKGDVILLEQIFNKMVPHVSRMPTSLGMIAKQNRDACGACGSTESIKQGFKYTNTGKYQKLLCKGCGKINVDSRMVKEEKK